MPIRLVLLSYVLMQYTPPRRGVIFCTGSRMYGCTQTVQFRYAGSCLYCHTCIAFFYCIQATIAAAAISFTAFIYMYVYLIVSSITPRVCIITMRLNYTFKKKTGSFWAMHVHCCSSSTTAVQTTSSILSILLTVIYFMMHSLSLSGLLLK